MRPLVVFGAALLATLPPAATTVWGQAPAGAEFQVNTYRTNAQMYPSVASDANGNFIVVWQSLGQEEASDFGVVGQRFNASGVPQASEFRVNSYTTGYQGRPRVASDANGNFVVVWENDDGNAFGVLAQRFDALGLPQGTAIRVNSYTTGDQRFPAVASDASGNFVVMWSSFGQDGSGFGLFGQRFDASGVPQAGEFRVNSYTTSTQGYAAVAVAGSGDFVVVWSSNGQDGSASGVFGRRFDASGAPQAGEFQINSYTTGSQFFPRLGLSAGGDFVVIWSGSGSDGSNFGVFGQRFDASGLPQASEFRVNSYTTGRQSENAVAADEDGNFVVVWQSDGQDGSGNGVFLQRFNASGVPQGSELRVNSYTVNNQSLTAVASNPDGDFVVVWNSNGQDGSNYGIFGQRFGDLIFQDGFESTDMSRWSSASTDGFDLSVAGAAAMAGTVAGLQAFVNDTNALFVQDDSPSAESRYRARFYFDPHGFDPGEAQSHFRTRIFIGFDDSGLRVITLVLKRQGGAYSIEGRVRLNDGTRADTGFLPITDDPHFFEFDWIRASGPGAGDGFFTLRIDDTPVSALAFLDNDANPVDFVRLGALSIKTGAAGTLFYDQLESRRQVAIGPE